MIKVSAFVAVQGGFSSKRGTYSVTHTSECEAPDAIEDSHDTAMAVLESARAQVKDDEVTFKEWVRIEAKTSKSEETHG